MPILPRQTRLVRVPDLGAYQQAIASRALEGSAVDARRRAVIVPTGAAARQLRRTLEASATGAFVLPNLVTRDGWYARMHEAMPGAPRLMDEFERDVLLYAAAIDARDAGAAPPFAIRAGIIAAMLRFYDELRRRDCDLLTFQRRIGAELANDSEDRGAERVARQTRFLAEAFAGYERRLIAFCFLYGEV